VSKLSQVLLFSNGERICKGGRRHSELFRVDARRSEGKLSSEMRGGRGNTAATPGRA